MMIEEISFGNCFNLCFLYKSILRDLYFYENHSVAHIAQKVFIRHFVDVIVPGMTFRSKTLLDKISTAL